MSTIERDSPYPFPIGMENPLEELGAKYQATKREHNYLPFYWMHFRDIRLKVKSFLEIGVQTDSSIRMWEEFFPNATIYGLDIDPKCKQSEGGRRKIFIGDQGDPEMLRQVIAQTGGLDIVVDDGSHEVEHQLASFQALYPALSSHGIYVVEDTGGCVRDYDLRVVSRMKTFVDQIFYWPQGLDAENWPFLSEFPPEADWMAKNTIGIAFYRWIVFVMRGNNLRDNAFLQPLSAMPRPARS